MATFAFQVLSIPLAFLIKFKSAYIMTFVIGYCYKVRFEDTRNEKERLVWEWFVIVGALIGVALRYFLEMQELQGLYKEMSDLTIQYIKLFWACAIFVSINKCVPQNSWNNIPCMIKEKLVAFAGCTYEIYLVHEFFVHKPYTSLFGNMDILYRVILVLFSIIIATFILCQVEKKAHL